MIVLVRQNIAMERQNKFSLMINLQQRILSKPLLIFTETLQQMKLIFFSILQKR